MTTHPIAIRMEFGGMSPEDIAKSEMVFLQERGMSVPRILSEQVGRVSEILQRIVDNEFKSSMLIEEAVYNAKLHGNKLDATKISRIALTIEHVQDETSERIDYTLSITDHSPPFDIESVPDPTTAETIDKPVGRGILLITELAKAQISQVPTEEGKSVTYKWTVDVSPAVAAQPEMEPNGGSGGI